MHVVGTAGHVDHGKSTLVEALTGIDPDRLKEEKDREMTIDLGFAWINLGPDRDDIGIVDVPGHRDFIENMLAGVGGIDLALLVIAADEGVMPQTSEHLAILDLLEVKGGLVALTKTDLVEDTDWLELVILDVTEALANTVLADAPIIPVSARTGDGIETLRQTLFSLLDQTKSRPNIGRPRLPIDRVFTLPGYGTIVTGTLIDGDLIAGENVEILPQGLRGRIRGLQTHRTKLDVAHPGSRVAVNISGIATDEIDRGNVLAAPGIISGTLLCDVAYRHLPEAKLPLKHNVEVKFFTGSAEVMARTRIIGANQISGGETGWIQLALSNPVAILKGDRFILRRPSPGETIGGGQILDPHPGRRHRRFRQDVITRFDISARGLPDEILLQTLERHEPISRDDLLKKSGLDPLEANKTLDHLFASGYVVLVGKQVISTSGWNHLHKRITDILIQFHASSPLRLGIPREELRSRLRLPAVIFNSLIEDAISHGLVKQIETLVHLPAHSIRFNEEQQMAVDALMSTFVRAGVNSPSVKDVKIAVGNEIYFALIDLGYLRQVSSEVVFTRADYLTYVGMITDFLLQHGRVSAAQVRDLLDTSRKYAIALLEHLDDIHVTRRVGDDRELI